MVQDWSWFKTGLGSWLVLVHDLSWFKTGWRNLEWEIALKSHQSLKVKYLESSKRKHRKSGIWTFENFWTTGSDVMSSWALEHIMQKLVKTGKYIFTNILIGRVTTNAKSDLNKNYWSIEFVDFNPVKLTSWIADF